MESARDFISRTALLITGVNLSPARVSAALDLVPDASWQRGDAKRVGDTPHKWGGWRKKLPPGGNEDPFSAELRTWSHLLSSRSQALRALQDEGAEVVLDCFISVSGAALFELDSELQQALAALGVNIRIAIWAANDVGQLQRWAS
jgi:hypothetical protein